MYTRQLLHLYISITIHSPVLNRCLPSPEPLFQHLTGIGLAFTNGKTAVGQLKGINHRLDNESLGGE